MPLTSRSGYEGGTYGSETEGPGGGSFTMRGRGRGDGMDFMGMFESMLNEKRDAARDARAREAERWKMEKQAARDAKQRSRVEGREKRKRRGELKAQKIGGIPGQPQLHRGPDYGQSMMSETFRREQSGMRQRDAADLAEAMLQSTY